MFAHFKQRFIKQSVPRCSRRAARLFFFWLSTTISIFNLIILFRGLARSQEQISIFIRIVIIFFLLTLEILTRIFFYVHFSLLCIWPAGLLKFSLLQFHRILHRQGKTKTCFSASIARSDKSFFVWLTYTIQTKHNWIVYRENWDRTTCKQRRRHDDFK